MAQKTHSDTPICAVLLGNAATPALAEAFACDSRGCPYVASYTAIGTAVMGLYVLPAGKRWWIEYPQEHPEVLGLQKAEVFITDRIEASSRWSLGQVEPVLETAPCGTDCVTCPHYQQRCMGCPATVFYRMHAKGA